MVILILLLVYRSPLLAIIPLITVGVSVFCSWAVLAELALLAQKLDFEFKVINITDIFVIVILFGAGTDYCLFLISRVREGLELDRPVGEAVSGAVGSVGGALAASAGTVICGLGMMVFAEFAKYRYTGPAVAVSLVVVLCAALTLAPSLLCLFGRSAFWTVLNRRTWLALKRISGLGRPDDPDSERVLFWEWASHRLARRPGVVLVACFAFMLPFALFGLRVNVTYDLLAELPSHKEAVLGLNAIRRHLPVGEMDPIKLLLGGERSEVDFNQIEAKLAVAALCDRLARFDGVVGVRSLSRPLGEPEPVAPVRPQNGSAPLLKLFGTVLDDIRTRVQQVKQQYYISGEGELAGRVTRIDIVLDQEPFTLDAMNKLEAIRRLVGEETRRPDSVLKGIEFSFAGATGVTNDLRLVTQRDDWRIRLLVVAGIFAILVVLLRKVGVSLYLILSVVFSYYVTLGVTRLVFCVALGYPGLHWTVPFFLFVLLIAVGEDYNIFLMSRVQEETKHHGPIEGVRVAMARTGAIITSCGLIMAGTFSSMLTGTLSALIELGFALAFGVLLDTFVVRPILVPTFLLTLHRLRGRR
jgi:uncharacterized membrane protein YdfJ with MMPL/SSD domain